MASIKSDRPSTTEEFIIIVLSKVDVIHTPFIESSATCEKAKICDKDTAVDEIETISLQASGRYRITAEILITNTYGHT